MHTQQYFFLKGGIHQDSMVLAQRQKYRSMEQNGKPRDNPHTYGYLIFDKGSRIYNREKTVCLICGAGETAQPLVKE